MPFASLKTLAFLSHTESFHEFFNEFLTQDITAEKLRSIQQMSKSIKDEIEKAYNELELDLKKMERKIDDFKNELDAKVQTAQQSGLLSEELIANLQQEILAFINKYQFLFISYEGVYLTDYKKNQELASIIDGFISVKDEINNDRKDNFYFDETNLSTHDKLFLAKLHSLQSLLEKNKEALFKLFRSSSTNKYSENNYLYDIYLAYELLHIEKHVDYLEVKYYQDFLNCKKSLSKDKLAVFLPVRNTSSYFKLAHQKVSDKLQSMAMASYLTKDSFDLIFSEIDSGLPLKALNKSLKYDIPKHAKKIPLAGFLNFREFLSSENPYYGLLSVESCDFLWKKFHSRLQSINLVKKLFSVIWLLDNSHLPKEDRATQLQTCLLQIENELSLLPEGEFRNFISKHPLVLDLFKHHEDFSVQINLRSFLICSILDLHDLFIDSFNKLPNSVNSNIYLFSKVKLLNRFFRSPDKIERDRVNFHSILSVAIINSPKISKFLLKIYSQACVFESPIVESVMAHLHLLIALYKAVFFNNPKATKLVISYLQKITINCETNQFIDKFDNKIPLCQWGLAVATTQNSLIPPWTTTISHFTLNNHRQGQEDYDLTLPCAGMTSGQTLLMSIFAEILYFKLQQEQMSFKLQKEQMGFDALNKLFFFIDSHILNDNDRVDSFHIFKNTLQALYFAEIDFNVRHHLSQESIILAAESNIEKVISNNNAVDRPSFSNLITCLTDISQAIESRIAELEPELDAHEEQIAQMNN